jgi:hypothetical protein
MKTKPFERYLTRIFSLNKFLKHASLSVTLTSIEIHPLLRDFDPSTSKFRSATVERMEAYCFVLEGNGTLHTYTYTLPYNDSMGLSINAR